MSERHQRDNDYTIHQQINHRSIRVWHSKGPITVAIKISETEQMNIILIMKEMFQAMLSLTQGQYQQVTNHIDFLEGSLCK